VFFCDWLNWNVFVVCAVCFVLDVNQLCIRDIDYNLCFLNYVCKFVNCFVLDVNQLCIRDIDYNLWFLNYVCEFVNCFVLDVNQLCIHDIDYNLWFLIFDFEGYIAK
jgi:hypothetical protein